MNKIMLEHYPASKLPDDLRAGMPADATVRVTVEEEARPSREELLSLLANARRNAKGVALEEAVLRIRELRDEWD